MTKAQFYTEIVKRYETLDTLGVYSDGTRVICRRGGVARAFLISDLIGSPFIFRVGTVSITIPANSFNAVGVVTLSPVLDDVTKYKAFASVNDIAAAWSARARIASISSLQVLATRSSTSNTGAAAAGSTDLASTPMYPSDTQTDIGLGHTHATNANGLADHTHTITGTHFHSNLPGSSLTLNADWMLVHT